MVKTGNRKTAVTIRVGNVAEQPVHEAQIEPE
jgi:hypothetical protein